MGLFSHKDTSHPAQQPVGYANQNVAPPTAGTATSTTTSTNKGGLFSKHKAASPPPQPLPVPVQQQHPVVGQENKSGGLFGRKSRSSEDSLPSGYAFSKHDGLTAARNKLAAAQEAEAAADAALIRSRNAVKEARAEIVALEKEAEMEARAAKDKAKAAKGLRQEGNRLGKHLQVVFLFAESRIVRD
ncbi:hypothetical protein JCM8547_002476 [Rhodosporidiobolus lusitaniae]